ncbi:hypothetical protein B1218_36450, partial [Pseudomonas ogarae]
TRRGTGGAGAGTATDGRQVVSLRCGPCAGRNVDGSTPPAGRAVGNHPANPAWWGWDGRMKARRSGCAGVGARLKAWSRAARAWRVGGVVPAVDARVVVGGANGGRYRGRHGVDAGERAELEGAGVGRQGHGALEDGGNMAVK